MNIDILHRKKKHQVCYWHEAIMLIRFVKQKFSIDDMIVVWSSCDCCQPLKHDCYDIFPKKERKKDSHLNMMSYSSEKTTSLFSQVEREREKKRICS